MGHEFDLEYCQFGKNLSNLTVPQLKGILQSHDIECTAYDKHNSLVEVEALYGKMLFDAKKWPMDYLHPKFDPADYSNSALRMILTMHEIKYPPNIKRPELFGRFAKYVDKMRADLGYQMPMQSAEEQDRERDFIAGFDKMNIDTPEYNMQGAQNRGQAAMFNVPSAMASPAPPQQHRFAQTTRSMHSGFGHQSPASNDRHAQSPANSTGPRFGAPSDIHSRTSPWTSPSNVSRTPQANGTRFGNAVVNSPFARYASSPRSNIRNGGAYEDELDTRRSDNDEGRTPFRTNHRDDGRHNEGYEQSWENSPSNSRSHPRGSRDRFDSRDRDHSDRGRYYEQSREKGPSNSRGYSNDGHDRYDSRERDYFDRDRYQQQSRDNDRPDSRGHFNDSRDRHDSREHDRGNFRGSNRGHDFQEPIRRRDSHDRYSSRNRRDSHSHGREYDADRGQRDRHDSRHRRPDLSERDAANMTRLVQDEAGAAIAAASAGYGENARARLENLLHKMN